MQVPMRVRVPMRNRVCLSPMHVSTYDTVQDYGQFGLHLGCF